MSRMRLTAIVLAAATLCGAAAWTVVADQSDARVASTPAAAQGRLPVGRADRDGRQRAGLGAAPAPPVSSATPVASATPVTESAVRPRAHAAPAPFVQSFAGQPGRARIKPGRSPKNPVKVAPTVDGCDRNYGTRAQCVPLNFPKGVRDRCAWLKAHGFSRVKVVVEDRQKLDPDRNGIACG
ncbi:hypothetical protein [Actinoplanes siamensis]|uniref:Excalibur calcium-binding domain-containing protein n=1 Tax=Actinoplanes siamensis TaxID=1223317 RepID=A0A919NC93_9ACTN|nr:hypothetical protein [Actinoplanes siamensis]GIF08283.1 hypothetical protein Asi03nite_58210 [Actinoplanes siamensis]